MPIVSVRDLDLYYEIRGAGPRVLSISRTGGDLRRSPNAFEIPGAGAATLLAYDQRGLGRTSKPDVPYTLAGYADDAAALLDALGWESCPVLGVSFGGMVAQELALRHPERVERLVLACTTAGGPGGSSYPLHELQNLPPAQYARRIVPLLDTRRNADWQASHATQFDDLVARIAGSLSIGAEEPGNQSGARRQVQARAGHDTWARLPRLRMPVLVCGGHFDGLAPAASVRALYRQIPGARLEFFDAGHNFYVEDARAGSRIVAFLRGG